MARKKQEHSCALARDKPALFLEWKAAVVKASPRALLKWKEAQAKTKAKAQAKVQAALAPLPSSTPPPEPPPPVAKSGAAWLRQGDPANGVLPGFDRFPKNDDDKSLKAWTRRLSDEMSKEGHTMKPTSIEARIREWGSETE